MGEAALRLTLDENPEVNDDNDSINIDLKDTFTEERVFALCGPMGAPIHKIGEKLKDLLESKYDYECEIIKLSSFIKKYGVVAEDLNVYEHISSLISAGDKLRHEYGADFLAKLAIKDIFSSRIDDEKNSQTHMLKRRKCFIIDSIKNQSELELFNTVYGKLFYFIGVFSTKKLREEALERKGMRLSLVYTLMEKDSGDCYLEQDKKYGQTVRKTFSHADFFIRVKNPSSCGSEDNKIERFLDLIFNTKIITPSKNEIAMHFAASAAGNSSCLSRQVGACLTDCEGNVLSLGWNDVPKYGGGLYSHDDSEVDSTDARCFTRDDCLCSNDLKKDQLIEDISNELISNGLMSEESKKQANSIIKKSGIGNLIEFSRAIHAEMLAIITAGKNSGHKIKRGVLYCTTYPCHNCARHIVTAGISTVFYIEPYAKSLAIDLHKDSISEDEADDNNKMQILSFDGIAPKRYLEFFTCKTNNRKEIFQHQITPREAVPKYEVSQESIKALESIVVNKLTEIKYEI